MNDKVYLRPNVQVEPLFNQWYAWIMLMPPATAAMNVAERHIPTMESYVNSAEMHAMAVKNPAMRGGPFIDLGGKRVDEVRELMEKTRSEHPQYFAFAKAVRELQEMLQREAKGYSLEPLYEKIPPLLRGYVELMYDMNHRPSFRFIEQLLYRSEFYDTSAQSIALSVTEKDNDRPFILSTPRLRDGKSLHVPVAFADETLDELFKMKKVPQSFASIRERLGIHPEDEEMFRSFFTDEAPPEYRKYTGDSMRIRYFGHACILVETKDISILFDPVLSYTYESDISRYTYEDLPDEIDYVMITHGHQDHILLETMLQIRHKVKNIIVGRNYEGLLQDPSLELMLRHLGFRNVIELRELDEIPIPGGSVTGIPFMGEHHDLMIQSKLAFFVKINGSSIFAVADSCNIEPALYERVHALTGDADILFLGMECDGSPPSWVYGPLFPAQIDREIDRSRRGRGCNYQEGIDLVNRFNCREVYVYAMGQEPWLRHILDLEYTETSNPIIQSKKLLNECREHGLVAEHLFAERELLVDNLPEYA